MIHKLVSLLVCFAMLAVAAPTIGTITSNGRFQMNGAETWNQGAIFDGARIETEKSISRLLLRNGTDLRIGAASQSRVYADHLILESGAVEGILSNTFHLETPALGLRVHGENVRAHIAINDGKVLVSSLAGAVSVRGPGGLLLASVQEGSAVQLSGGNGATAGVELTGVIEYKNSVYILKDCASNVTVQLTGSVVAKYVGKHATIIGEVDPRKPSLPSAEYRVAVKQARPAPEDSPSCSVSAGGMGTGSKIGIIAGVVVAGASTTGLVIAGTDEQQQTVSPLR
ncbi:MAG: hypothetical protein KIT83_20850 [Bryobacterales bacterium]|nr:hypothetical protein [Bryobacterales bacterium]